MPALLNQLNEDLEEVVERARKSLVRVASGEGANGAGSIWHPDGLIVTNAHVVQRPPIRVMLADGRALPAEVLAIDHERDVAALSVAANGLPTCELGESRKLKAGEWVVALGHPWGVTGASTVGVVIGVDQGLSGSIPPNRGWIAVCAALRPGNSGGPLVDSGGRLVGINTVMAGPQVGYAVPVHEVKNFLFKKLGHCPPSY